MVEDGARPVTPRWSRKARDPQPPDGRGRRAAPVSRPARRPRPRDGRCPTSSTNKATGQTGPRWSTKARDPQPPDGRGRRTAPVSRPARRPLASRRSLPDLLDQQGDWPDRPPMVNEGARPATPRRSRKAPSACLETRTATTGLETVAARPPRPTRRLARQAPGGRGRRAAPVSRPARRPWPRDGRCPTSSSTNKATGQTGPRWSRKARSACLETRAATTLSYSGGYPRARARSGASTTARAAPMSMNGP